MRTELKVIGLLLAVGLSRSSPVPEPRPIVGLMARLMGGLFAGENDNGPCAKGRTFNKNNKDEPCIISEYGAPVETYGPPAPVYDPPKKGIPCIHRRTFNKDKDNKEPCIEAGYGPPSYQPPAPVYAAPSPGYGVPAVYVL